MKKHQLIKEIIDLAENFDASDAAGKKYTKDVHGFKEWVYDEIKNKLTVFPEPAWAGKEKNRSAESAISTFIVHMNRYAKTYSKAAIHNSDFSTQEEFIYLINLKAFGSMTKMELIKKNIQEKAAGMQIITRLIKQGWIDQQNSESDKRSKVIQITEKGLQALDKQMNRIRQATKIVAGNLTYNEKMELIRLLHKLDTFHKPIFSQNIESSRLLDRVLKEYMPDEN